MAWIEAHQELPRHPKTKRLARILKISIPQAVGHLFLFWWWALDYAESGDVSKYDAYDIADAVEWQGDPEEFLKAMIECGPGGTSGFIEKAAGENGEKFFIHDWDEYSGRLLEKREQNRKRQAKARKEKREKIVEEEKTYPENYAENNFSENLQQAPMPANAEYNENPSEFAFVTRDSNVTSANVACESQGYRTQHNRTEQNTTLHNKTEQNTTNTTATATGQKKNTETITETEQTPGHTPIATEAKREISLSDLVFLWNSRMVPFGFPRIAKKTQPRERALKTILAAAPERNDYRWWQNLFDRVLSSEFLRTSILEKNWLTLDWLLIEHNLVKVIEGRYDNKPKAAAAAAPQVQQNQQEPEEEPRPTSIEEILARHQAREEARKAREAQEAIEAEYNVINNENKESGIGGGGGSIDGERAPSL